MSTEPTAGGTNLQKENHLTYKPRHDRKTY